MYGFLPVYEAERGLLESYANQNETDLCLLLSIRNQLRIQSEVTVHRRPADIIANKFFTKLDHKISESSVKDFCADLKQPIHHIIKSIASDPRYEGLSINEKKNVFQPINDIVQIEKKSRTMSERFEHKVEEVLRSNNVQFLTEREIIQKKLHKITPDILIENKLEFSIENCPDPYQINWIDAKNFVYLGDFMPFFKKKIIKQAEKYHKEFGNGALVFRHGIYDEIGNEEMIEIIPGVILIDWKQIKKQ